MTNPESEDSRVPSAPSPVADPTPKTPALAVTDMAAIARAMSTPDRMMEFATKGALSRPRHLRVIGKAVADAVRKGGGRIIITAPPRHGKSWLLSWWLPTWFLCLWPKRKVILAGYETDFAAQWGRKVRDTMGELKWLVDDVEVRRDSNAANRWELKGHGGGMITAGAGGRLSGFGGDLIICDDPVKNAEEGVSEVTKASLWDWWSSTFTSRLEPGGTIILMHTRWSDDDLIGRVLEQDKTSRRWQVLNFPALAEEGDLLGREPGEPLWPERYDKAALKEIEERNSYTWASLYQQHPIPAEGGVFKREWFGPSRRYDVVTDSGGAQVYSVGDGRLSVQASQMQILITVDLATSTRTWADYTVIAVWGLYMHQGTQPFVFLLDVLRKRMEGPDITASLYAKVQEWGADVVWVERVAFQLAFVQDARRAGLPIREWQPDKDKVARAMAATPYCEGGQVLLPRYSAWLEKFESEILGFPRGRHDDQVDTLSMMINVLRPSRGGIPGDIDPFVARERRAEIQSCVAEPGADPVDSILSGSDSGESGRDWAGYDYFDRDQGRGDDPFQHFSSGE